MSLTGTVVNGVVVFDGGPVPPEGTRVEVVLPAERAAGGAPTAPTGETPTGPHAWMLKFAGKAVGMPADFAEQHDHYIHGTPKR